MRSQERALDQSWEANPSPPHARRAGIILFASRQPAAHLPNPTCRLLGSGGGLGRCAGGPGAQDSPLVFVQDLVAGSLRLLPTHPSQPVDPPSHHQINGQARFQTIRVIQTAILDATAAFDRAVIDFDTPAAAIPAQPPPGLREALRS